MFATFLNAMSGSSPEDRRRADETCTSIIEHSVHCTMVEHVQQEDEQMTRLCGVVVSMTAARSGLGLEPTQCQSQPWCWKDSRR